jgi:hypothetical protein
MGIFRERIVGIKVSIKNPIFIQNQLLRLDMEDLTIFKIQKHVNFYLKNLSNFELSKLKFIK